MDVMDKRRQTIDDGLSNADKAKHELESMRQQKEKVLAEAKQESMTMLQDALRDAETRRQELLAKADQDAKSLVEKTKKQLAAEQQRMLDEAKGQLASLVVEAAGKVVAEQLDDNLQRKLADRAVQELTKA
jgi:F-type H+-transporting ATPase subunit b